MPITHAKVLPGSDDSDGSTASPSDWNDAHVGSAGGLPSQWTDGGNGDVTAETDDSSKGPLTVIAPDTGVDEAYGIEVDAGGLDFEGAILIVTGDQSLITGSGFVIRAVPIVGGRQILDIDSWGSMSLAADPDGGGGFQLTAGDDNTVYKVVAGTGLADSRTDINVPVRIRTQFTLDANNAAPDDSYLDPGSMTLWFDDTNGASALKIKGKTADGTVVTATVPLT